MRNPKKLSLTSRAFTLIELLVVIAIIAILAAILFPVFARAREKARQSHCINNLRQMGFASRSYMSDYDEVVVPCYLYEVHPSAGTLKTGAPVLRWFPDLLYPYVRNNDIARCPNWSALYDYGRQKFPPGEGAGLRLLRWSYGGNNWHWWPEGQNKDPDILGPMGVNRPGLNINQSDADIKDPGNCILVIEATNLEIWSPPQHDYCRGNKLQGFEGYPVKGWVHYRHNQGFNVLFVDSHTKWLKETRPEMWAADPKTMTRDPSLKPCLPR